MSSRLALRFCSLLGVTAALTACPSDDDGSESGQSTSETSTGTDTATSTSSDGTTTDSTTTGTGTDTEATTSMSGTEGGTDGSTGGSTGGAAGCGAPVELGVYAPSDGDARGFAVDGDTLYVAGAGGGLFVADITDPANPSELGLFDFGVGELAFRVAVSGNYAYVALRGDGYSIVDVSNPASMMEVGSNDAYDARDIAVANDVLYIPNNTGLVTVDVSDPSMPEDLDTDLVLAGSTESVVVVGDTAYVGSTGAGLLIVDVSSPDAPVEVGHYDVMGNGFISVDGDYAFVSTGDGVDIVDISNPAMPMMVAQHGDRAHASVADAGRLFLLGDDTVSTDVPFLSVLDVSDPSMPMEEHTAFDTFEDPSWVAFDGTHLMFSTEDDDSVHITDACPPL